MSLKVRTCCGHRVERMWSEPSFLRSKAGTEGWASAWPNCKGSFNNTQRFHSPCLLLLRLLRLLLLLLLLLLILVRKGLGWYGISLPYTYVSWVGWRIRAQLELGMSTPFASCIDISCLFGLGIVDCILSVPNISSRLLFVRYWNHNLHIFSEFWTKFPYLSYTVSRSQPTPQMYPCVRCCYWLHLPLAEIDICL